MIHQGDCLEVMAAMERARQEMRYRYQDLRDCGKDDDCRIKAEGALLAIEDFDEVLAEYAKDRGHV